MSLSIKKRFSIFERDNFCCQYCGKKPPEVVLEVDHIVSKKDKGKDDDMNLITSCFVCNRGKSSKSVDIQKMKNKTFKQELKLLKEKKCQLEAYYDFLSKKESLEFEEMNIYQRRWEECSNDESSLTEKGIKDMQNLSKKYDSEMIFEAIKIAWDADHVRRNGKFPYMCGILKNMQQQKDDSDLPKSYGS